MTELNFFSDGPPRAGRGEAESKAPPRQPPPPAEETAPPPAEEEKLAAAQQQQPAPPPSPPAPAVTAGRVIQVFSTPDAAQAAPEPEAAGSPAGDENVIDADFEVKD